MWNRQKSISALDTVLEQNLDRYQYYLARYYNDISVDLRMNWETTSSWNPITYRQDSDLADEAQTNVIKSVIDSIVSKLANQKVRPYFNTINGNYKTKQAVRKAQHFFDVLLSDIDGNGLLSEAFRNACIFGIGYLYIDPVTLKVSVLPTWCVATLNSERGYLGKPTRMMIKQHRYPTTNLKNVEGNKDYVCRIIYIDTVSHEYVEYFDNKEVAKHNYHPDELPIVPVYYNKPVFGNQTTGIVQELNGIQTQIDLINAKIAAAAQLSPANTTYVIEGSNLKPGDISNRVGDVYGVKMPPGVNTPPVVNVTPAPFDPAWTEMRNQLIDMAYEVIGVSQLSAESKKPAGVDSGVALQTMQDVESDRFMTQISQYVQSYVDLVRLYIDVVPEDTDVLAEYGIIKWKEIKEMSGKMKIQYSAATALSKEPSEKLKQLMQLSQTGLIGADKIAQYLDTPDLEDAYKGAQAVSSGVESCIEDAIDNEVYDIPDFVNYKQLAQQIAVTQNELYSSRTGDKKGDFEIDQALFRLGNLEQNLMSLMESNGFIDDENGEEKTVDDGPMSGLTGSESAVHANDITDQVNQEAADANIDNSDAQDIGDNLADSGDDQGLTANTVGV